MAYHQIKPVTQPDGSVTYKVETPAGAVLGSGMTQDAAEIRAAVLDAERERAQATQQDYGTRVLYNSLSRGQRRRFNRED